MKETDTEQLHGRVEKLPSAITLPTYVKTCMKISPSPQNFIFGVSIRIKAKEHCSRKWAQERAKRIESGPRK